VSLTGCDCLTELVGVTVELGLMSLVCLTVKPYVWTYTRQYYLQTSKPMHELSRDSMCPRTVALVSASSHWTLPGVFVLKGIPEYSIIIIMMTSYATISSKTKFSI